MRLRGSGKVPRQWRWRHPRQRRRRHPRQRRWRHPRQWRRHCLGKKSTRLRRSWTQRERGRQGLSGFHSLLYTCPSRVSFLRSAFWPVQALLYFGGRRSVPGVDCICRSVVTKELRRRCSREAPAAVQVQGHGAAPERERSGVRRFCAAVSFRVSKVCTGQRRGEFHGF